MAKPKVGRPKGRLALGVFRDQLYKFGKASGYAVNFPGVKQTKWGSFLQQNRGKAYTIARGIGTGETLASQTSKHGFKAAFALRGSRILTGHLTGMAINAVVPVNLPNLVARFARAKVGSAISKSGAFNMFNRQLNARITTGMWIKYDGPKINRQLRKGTPLQKSQFILSQTELMIRSFAPDVSSGQYLIGFDSGHKKDYQEAINERQMAGTNSDNWVIDKTAYHNNRATKRDIFGFKKPGEARSFLLKSIKQIPMKASKTSDALMKGQIHIGGPDFPWAWAVEYGGMIPYMHIDKYKGKPVHKDKYIPPTFFIHRAVEAVVRQYRDSMLFDKNQSIKVGSMETRKQYKQWLKLARTRGGLQTMQDKQKSFLPKRYKTKPGYSAKYKAVKQTRGTAALSKMENKIPGPTVQNVHGNFYSPELSKAIGIKFVPEEITFRFETTGGESKDVLKRAAQETITGQRKSSGSLFATKEDLTQGQIVQRMRQQNQDLGTGKRTAEVLKNVYNITVTDKGKTRIVKLTKKRSDAGQSRGPNKNYSSGTKAEKLSGSVKQNARVKKSVDAILGELDEETINEWSRGEF